MAALRHRDRFKPPAASAILLYRIVGAGGFQAIEKDRTESGTMNNREYSLNKI